MATASPKLGLRPFLPADAPLLAEIFRASIAELTADDYSEAQQVAWASAADDEAEFNERLGRQLTLVGTLDGSPVGFISLAGAEQIDMLYVHPVVAGQGMGTMLCDAVEKLAAARGAAKLKVEASDTASDFFKHRGFVAQQRNSVSHAGEGLADTTLEKKLPAKEGRA